MLRAIPLRVSTAVAIDADGNRQPITWASLLRIVMTAPRRDGLQITEMRQISQVLDALDKAEQASAEQLLLTDLLWSYVRGAVERHKWGGYLPELVAFTDDVAGASTVNPNSK